MLANILSFLGMCFQGLGRPTSSGAARAMIIPAAIATVLVAELQVA